MNPFDQSIGNESTGVDFVDEKNGWVIGEGGVILHTVDGGMTWQVQRDLLIKGTFTSIDFVDRNHGWIVGGGGYIFHTANGGFDWERQKSPTNLDLYDVFFLDRHKGWAVGYGTLLLHTEDGGTNWHLQQALSFENSYMGITFVDSSKGWIVGTAGLVLHTQDGGRTWQKQISGLEWEIDEVSFVDSLNGWACGCSTIRTTDGGRIWRKVDDTYAQAMSAVSNQEAWIVGPPRWHVMMKHTTDGGKTWSPQSYGSSNQLKDIFFLNHDKGWGVGYEGLIVNTKDGGITWDIQNERKIDIFLDGTFINSLEGWMIGGLSQKLYHTMDGGFSWVGQTIKDSVYYSSVNFTDKRHGWVSLTKTYMDKTGNLLNEYYLNRTVDGGLTWQNIWKPSAYSIFTFVDSLTGFSAEGSTIGYTTDGGDSWQKSSIEPGVSFGVTDIYFADHLNGWAVGMNGSVTDTGIILKTVDGGKSWQVNVEETATGMGVYFTDRLHGIVVGSNPPVFEGVVMRTADGGENWEIQYMPCSWLRDVVFTNDTIGWTVGDYGFIWKTVDRGKNWNRIESGTMSDLNRIVFVENGKVGFIFGDKNTLLRYDASQERVEDKAIHLSPEKIELFQNYPNPFNNETNITYRLMSSSFVVLKILDLTGREVVTLVDGFQSSGRHVVKWTGRDKENKPVSGGIYLLHIGSTVGDEGKTIKLLMTK